MIYKQIELLIPKEEFQKSNIISRDFVLELSDNSIVLGTVTLKDGTLAVGFGVVLEEIDQITNVSVDKCFTFTDNEGKYYIAFTPLENKLYTVCVYRSIYV